MLVKTGIYTPYGYFPNEEAYHEFLRRKFPEIYGSQRPTHSPPQTTHKPNQTEINRELRKLVAQGVPPEKAAQIVSERYGVKAEVYKVHIPSLTKIHPKPVKRQLSPLERIKLEIAKRRVAIERKGDIERSIPMRLIYGAELAGLGFVQGGLNVAESLKDLANLARKNPADFGKNLVTGSIEWAKSIPERVKLGFTESPFFVGTVASEIAIAEAGGRLLGKAIPESVKTKIPVKTPIEQIRRRLTEFKPAFTVIEIGKQKTIMKGKTPSEVAIVGMKDFGKIQEIKPISATVIETGFKLEEGEGLGVGRIRQRLGWELRTEKGEPIRITTVYKNLLGKRAMITSEFGEKAIRILAKKAKGEEVKGFGIRIGEIHPIRSQEMTEKPVIRAIGTPKEFIPKEETKPPKVIDVRGLIGEAPITRPTRRKTIEVGRRIEQIVKAEKEAKSIAIVDVSKEVKALERAITETKPMVGFAPTMPLVVPPVFTPPTFSYAPPTFSVPTVPVELELIRPKPKTELFTPLEVGIQPTVGLKTSFVTTPSLVTSVKPLTTPIEIIKPSIKPLIETKPLVEPIVKVEPIIIPETKPIARPITSLKPISVPITSIGIPLIPIINIPIPNLGFSLGFGASSFVVGKPSKKKGKKKYIGLLAGLTEVTLTELLTGRKAHHLMVPSKMAKFWKQTLKTGGIIEVPTFEQIIGKTRRRGLL